MSGTSTTQIIFFITSILVAAGVSVTIASSISSFADAVHADSVHAAEKYRSSITIINDPERISSSIYVKNTGKTTLNPDLVTLFVDGSYTVASNHTVVGGNAWSEGMVLNITTSLPTGVHTARVVLQNGVSDSLRYRKV